MSQLSVATNIVGNNFEGTLQDFLKNRPPGSEWIRNAVVNGKFRKDPILESPGLMENPEFRSLLRSENVRLGLGAPEKQPNRVRVVKEGNGARIVERIYGNKRYNVSKALNAFLGVTGASRVQQIIQQRRAANAEAAQNAQNKIFFSQNERRKRRNAERAIRDTFENRPELYQRVAERMQGRQNIKIANMLATPELFQSLLLDAAYKKRLTSEALRVKTNLKAIENLANTEQIIQELNLLTGGLVSRILNNKKVNRNIFNEIRKTEAFKTLRSQLNDRLQELLAYLTSPYNFSNQAERVRRGAALAEFLALPYEFANQLRILIVEQMATLVQQTNRSSYATLMEYVGILRGAGNHLITTLVQRVPSAARQIRNSVRQITGVIQTNGELRGAIMSALQAGIAAGSFAAMTGDEGALSVAGTAAAARAAVSMISRLRNYAIPLMRAYMFPPAVGGEAANGSNRTNRSVLTNNNAFYSTVNTLSLPSGGVVGGSQNLTGFTPRPSLNLNNVAAVQAAAAGAPPPRKRAKAREAGPSRGANSNQEENN